MKKTLMTVQWPRVIAVMAPIPVLWLIVAGSPVAHVLWVVLAIAGAALLAATLRIGWGRTTRAMTDVIDDVEAESPPARPAQEVSHDALTQAGGLSASARRALR
jgi:hypothetical protein